MVALHVNGVGLEKTAPKILQNSQTGYKEDAWKTQIHGNAFECS